MIDFETIDKQVTDILNGTRDIPGFNQQEHAGICSAGPSLIGALIVCYDTRKSLTTSTNASGGQAASPSNWIIDETQEKSVQQWAEEKGIWVPNAEELLTENYGPEIAHGVESKVYYRTGDPSVVKLRASIYATFGRALESIALHNFFFPETMMRISGFTRTQDGLFRTILTQPYIECKRLATKAEINEMISSLNLSFTVKDDGNQVNFQSERYNLEDMHPANVFIDMLSDKPICIDCIAKFKRL